MRAHSALPAGGCLESLLTAAAGQRFSPASDPGTALLHSQGEAERELVRVPAECCLQEAGWNPYYAALLARLAAASTSHAVTLQYCLWDHFKVARRHFQRGCPCRRVTSAVGIRSAAGGPTMHARVGCSQPIAPYHFSVSVLLRELFTHL